MAFTTEQLETIEKAIASGTKKIKYGDKETEFHSLAEMMSLRDAMKAEINGTPTLAQRRNMAIFRSTLNRC